MSKWTEKDIPDLNGKVIIVTGANSGLGYENTKQFAKNGAYVIMACRNMESGRKALDKVKEKVPNGLVELMELDLGNLESIKSFAENFKEKFERLDVLLNNAGIMMVPYQKTVDGFESQVGINHLGHFALTAQLFDTLVKTDNARIVNVSSTGHSMGKMDWDDFMFEENYSRTRAYGRSKLSNLLFTYEMDRRLKAKGIEIKSVAAHPGAANTNLGNHLLGPISFLKPILMGFLILLMGHSAASGALPSSRAATDPNVKSGEYYGPKGWFGRESRGPPKLVKSNARSHSLEDGKKLWEVSEQLTGIKFEI